MKDNVIFQIKTRSNGDQLSPRQWQADDGVFTNQTLWRLGLSCGGNAERTTGSNAGVAGGTGLISHRSACVVCCREWCVCGGRMGGREEEEKRRGGPVDALDPSVV